MRERLGWGRGLDRDDESLGGAVAEAHGRPLVACEGGGGGEARKRAQLRGRGLRAATNTG